MKVGAVGGRVALLAVDKVVRGDGLPQSSGLLDTFKRMTITYDDFLIY